jgi:hypothetical protein
VFHPPVNFTLLTHADVTPIFQTRFSGESIHFLLANPPSANCERTTNDRAESSDSKAAGTVAYRA